MDEPLLLSKSNLVVVGKNPPGKPFHEGGDTFILDPNHADGVLCQFVLGGKKVMDDYLFPSISKITSTIQRFEHGGLTLQKEELWRIVEKAFYAYDQRKLPCAFIRNEQLACAIYDEKGGNDHTKLDGTMHFNVRKCCMPIYDEEEDG